jgi:hypothetical protein
MENRFRMGAFRETVTTEWQSDGVNLSEFGVNWWDLKLESPIAQR